MKWLLRLLAGSYALLLLLPLPLIPTPAVQTPDPPATAVTPTDKPENLPFLNFKANIVHRF